MNKAYVPYGTYWSTPFAKWQGSLGHLHSMKLAANVARDTLAAKKFPLEAIDLGILGITIPQPSSFFGLPWVTGMIGIPNVPGPTVSQACATSARVLQMAADEVEKGSAAGEEGVFGISADSLAKLKPVKPNGTVTFGGQTHPADGNAGMIVTTKERASELAQDKVIEVQFLGFGQARVEKGHMPMAPVPAARAALKAADLEIKDIDAVKTHNPFAVNDTVFARDTGFPVERMNNYGSSLIFGHPQGPTGMRSVIELIEELALRGGGNGLFTGCAAGDTAMAMVLNVNDSRKAWGG